MKTEDTYDQITWWLGLADVVAEGTYHGVEKLERVHLAIADEPFRALDQFLVTQPLARLVKHSHHGIARLCYGAVKLGAQGVSAGVARFPARAG